ncbi:hypothetical protein [Streptomyces acidiscabies]|uniref:Uncharacterized protein n=1 Tax=Streptomyces acidiscabies TaxID=42234 RepID=A0AAP6BD19_9ACTN|nr:hypothetical protein [Streptomyces acidiscabies]MDX2962408.1 hypothetical protein [Streptomyces acidiscabies]MDX3792427.1 hypothetical protein [Streptomyces acidiscabies]
MTTGLDLLAEGGTVTLTDGTEVPLRYSFRALALLEARFGSVGAVQTAIDSTGDGAAFGPLSQIIGAGTVGPGGFEPHIREHVDAKGKRTISDIVYRRRADGVMLDDLLDPGRLDEYTKAFTAALGRALESRSPGNAPTPAEATLLPFPGDSSSISPSVPSTFLPTPSGT